MGTHSRVSAAVALALILLAPVALTARQQFANIQVTTLLDAANRASIALRFDEARQRVDEATTIAEKLGDQVGLAMCHRMLGVVLRHTGKPAESYAALERALGEFEGLKNQRGVADVLGNLVATAIQFGDTARLRELSPRALKAFETAGDERSRANLLGNLVLSGLEPELEASRIDEMLAIAKRLNSDGIRGIALTRRAANEFDGGNYATAKASYEEAIAALERTKDVEAVANAYLSLGRVYRAHGDYEGAILRYQKAIDLLASTGDRYTIVQATNAKAIALGYLKRTKESLATYEQGLALARESGSPRLVDLLEGNLANALLDAGEWAKGAAALEVNIARKPNPDTLAYRQTTLANAFSHLGREQEAIALINEVIRYSREAKLTDLLAGRLSTRAEILTRAGRLDDALIDVREMASIYEDLRARLVPSDFLKRGYSDRVQDSYKLAVEVLSRLGRSAEALEMAEQGRSRAFADLLSGRESAAVPTRGDVTAGDLPSESLSKSLGLPAMRQTLGRLQSTLVSYWVNEDATIIWVVRPAADAIHLRVPITRDKLGALVAATRAPLRETAATATTRGEADRSAPTQTASDDLTDVPMRGLGLLALSRDDRAAWRELYKTLIEPVRAQLPRTGRLIIVPHGPLFQLSFAALRSPAGRYLLEDYELSYAPSISVLDFTSRRQQTVRTNASSSWAIVGNPATLPAVGNRPLPPLPGAAQEIDFIAKLAPKGQPVIRLEGARADETQLVQAIEKAHPSVLHFATHGFVFDDPKVAPFLALNRRGNTSADDGRLTLDEVYGLRLDTDLVVLSACRSGSGQVSSDGVIGLTRGFFYAGSPTVLATFWDVVDQATANVMSGFYRQYVKTHAKGASLRTAQLALLADLRAGKVVVVAGGRQITLPEHPLLWAAFFLSGEP